MCLLVEGKNEGIRVCTGVGDMGAGGEEGGAGVRGRVVVL